MPVKPNSPNIAAAGGDTERAPAGDSHADTQASVVAAERQVQIQEFQASAAVKTAEGQAASRKLVADGEAYATRATGNADAEKTKAEVQPPAALRILRSEDGVV